LSSRILRRRNPLWVRYSGPGKRNEKGEHQPLDVKVGDKIIFSKYAGTEIELEGEEYLILQEDEILGILES